jgi:hypothetical protein
LFLWDNRSNLGCFFLLEPAFWGQKVRFKDFAWGPARGSWGNCLGSLTCDLYPEGQKPGYCGCLGVKYQDFMGLNIFLINQLKRHFQAAAVVDTGLGKDKGLIIVHS